MLIKTDGFWCFLIILPIGFKFPKPNFSLSQEFSGTKFTIEKSEALSMSFVGTLPFGGAAKARRAIGLPDLCPDGLYPLFSWHTSSARGEGGKTKAVNKVGQNCELCGGFLLAGELVSSLSIRFVVSRMTMIGGCQSAASVVWGEPEVMSWIVLNTFSCLPDYLYGW